MAEHDFRYNLLNPEHTLIECRALAPGRYQVTGNGGSIQSGDTLLVSGELIYVFANPGTQTSMPVPTQLRTLLQAFEAGRPMLDLRLGTWDALGREAQAIRTEVFVQEQQIPAEMEWDAADAACMHAVAYNRFVMAPGGCWSICPA